MLNDRPILYLAIGQTLVWAALYYLFPASLLAWESSFGWSRTELTFGIALAVLASGAAAPLAGRIIDQGHGAAQMALSAALGGLGLILLSNVTSLWQFHALWLFIGVMQAGCLYEPCFALLTRSRGAGARRGIVTITLIAGFAGTVSFPVVNALNDALGWRSAVTLIGVFVIVVVAPLLLVGARGLRGVADEPTAPEQSHNAGSRLVGDPVFWLLGLAFACLAITHGATLHHLLPILAERGVPSTLAVSVAAAIGPMQVLGRLIMVAAGRRLHPRHLALVTFAAMALAMLVLRAAGGGATGIWAFAAIFGAAYGTVSILRPVITRAFLGQAGFGAISGGMAFIYLAASASSAWLGSLAWAFAGYNRMLLALAGLSLVGAMLFLAADRRAVMTRNSTS